MPLLSTPRIVVALIASPPGSVAPTSARGAFIPAATLGAPHTTERGAPVPASTLHTVSRSAFGCFCTDSTWPTTTPLKGGATGEQVSTSTPDIVSRCASSSDPSGGSTKLRSQRSEICMGSGELPQKAQVVFEEQPQVVDPVAKHGEPLQTRAERKAEIALRIQAIAANHVRMHLPGAGNLQPLSLVR